MCRLPLTLLGCLVIVVLHVLRETSPTFAELYRQSAFSPNQWTLERLLFSPVFHSNFWHMLANLVSFLFFVGVVELIMGTVFAAVIVALGCWLSNPLTAAILIPLFKVASPDRLVRFVAETDVGASNAIYAVVGAMAGLLIRPGNILGIFVFNALFYAVASESWLSMHHVVALWMGFVFCRMSMRQPAAA